MNNLLAYAKIAQDCYNRIPDIGKFDSAGRAVLYPDTPLGSCVAFLGTSDLMGWIADLDALTTSTPDFGRLHAGFWATYQDMAPRLVLQSPDVITGHSLGGSLALIYAASLCRLNKPPKKVYAYEPARPSVDAVMRTILATSGVDIIITRNGDDIVPKLPRIGGYWQMPIPTNKILVLKSSTGGIDPLTCISDHLIGNVIKSIQQLEQTK